MKVAAGFLLVIGCLWGLLVALMFLTIAGVAAPESWARVALYWGSMLVGPLMLIIGAVFLLRGTSLRPGTILVGIGCVILTAFVLYNTITGLQRKPLQAPPPYLFYVVLLLVMIFSDVAACRIYKAIGGLR